MENETLRMLIEAVRGVSGDAKDVLMAYIAVKAIAALSVSTTVVTVFVIVARTIENIANHALAIKQMQHDLGYSGDLRPIERANIMRVWRAGLKAEGK